MRRDSKFFVAFALLFSISSYSFSQPVSRPAEDMERPFRESLIITGFGGSGSNGLNQYVMNRLAFGGYISTEKMQNAEDLIKKRNRTGFLLNGILQFYLPPAADTPVRIKKKFHLTNIQYRQMNLIGARYSEGMWKLAFRGNEPYLGQTLTLDKSGFRQFVTRNIYFGFSDLYDKNGTKLSMDIGLGQLVSYRNLRIKKGSLYTEPDRNYIDVQYDATYQNTGRRNFSGSGIGLLTNWNWNKRTSKTWYQVSIVGLGFYHTGNALQIEKHMDTAARLNQSSISYSKLNSSDWLDYFRDTATVALRPDTSSYSGLVLAPFYVFFATKIKQVQLDLAYTYIPGFLPRIGLRPAKAWRLNGSFSFSPELQLGGFDTYNVNAMFSYNQKHISSNAKHTVRGFVRFQGIESMILPQLEHGAGLGFGLIYLVR